MPSCYKCGTSKGLEQLNPYQRDTFICHQCRLINISVPKLHKSRSREQWDKMAYEANERLSRKWRSA